VVSVLDSGAEGPGFKSLPGNSLRQTVHTHRASVHQAAKLVAALLRVAGVTVGLAESNDSLPSPTCLYAVANYPACVCCCRRLLMEAIEDTSLADSITRLRALSCLPNEYDTIACPLSDRRRVFLVATSRELDSTTRARPDPHGLFCGPDLRETPLGPCGSSTSSCGSV